MKTSILNSSLVGTKVITTKEETIVAVTKFYYLTDVPASVTNWSFTHKEIASYDKEYLKTVTVVVSERDATQEEIGLGMSMEDIEEMFSVMPI